MVNLFVLMMVVRVVMIVGFIIVFAALTASMSALRAAHAKFRFNIRKRDMLIEYL
jgi:hypothetical protein